jgi:hypothetical protein
MADNQFAVSNIRIRQSAQLDGNGNPFTATLVSFLVGQHGPFTLMFAPGQGSPAAITAAITATQNEIKTLVSNVANLNAQG